MKEEKVILRKRETRKKIIRMEKVSQDSHEVKNLVERKFGNDPALKKRIIIKEDGRYLIYYNFNK